MGNTLSESVAAYFQGWNAHDPAKVASLFVEEGTYEDPVSRMAVRAYDIETVMWSITEVFSDLQFEIVSTTIDGGRAVVEWVLHGTNSKGLKPGIEPTGKKAHVPGVEILEGRAGFTRVTRYFDQNALHQQIGMQVIVEPFTQGKAVYGYSKRVTSGNPAMPSTVGMTWIRFRDQSELDRIRLHSAKIIQDFVEEPGFISIVTGAAGDRAFTVTAWENEDALYRALDKAHSRAKHDFRTEDISPGVWTSVWKPLHINRMWSRCLACANPNDVTDDHRNCVQCGAPLPERHPYW
jgi:steroid delta-isomerase-like uncharacterized protein